MSWKCPAVLILMRHVRSEMQEAKGPNDYFENEESLGRVKGIPDHRIPVVKEELARATKTGEYIYKTYGLPDVAFHSGFDRAVQTLHAVIGAFPENLRRKILIRKDERVRERSHGWISHMTKGQIEEHFPWYIPHLEMTGDYHAVPPGGESVPQVVDRVTLFIEKVSDMYAGKNVLVVTHAAALKAIRSSLENWPVDKWHQEGFTDNCGLTIYQPNGNDELGLVKADQRCW